LSDRVSVIESILNISSGAFAGEQDGGDSGDSGNSSDNGYGGTIDKLQ